MSGRPLPGPFIHARRDPRPRAVSHRDHRNGSLHPGWAPIVPERHAEGFGLVSGALLFLLWALIAVVGLIGALLVALAGGPLGWGLLTAGAILGLGWCLQERD